MSELLRYLARTSIGWLPLAGTVAIVAWVFVDSEATWAGDWWWGYNSVAQTLSISSILVAFATGWDAGRAGSGYRHTHELRPVRALAPELLRITWVTAPVLAVYATATAVVAVITVVHRGEIDGRAPLVVLSHALMLVAAASFGTFAGRHLSAPAAALAAAGVTGVLNFVTTGVGHQVFGLTGASSAIVGFTPSVRYFSWNIAVLALCVLVLHQPARGRRGRAGSAVPAAAALVVIAVGAFAGPAQAFSPTDQRATRCAEDEPEICVYPGYDGLLASTRRLVSVQLTAADDAGVSSEAFPSRLEQMGGGRMTARGVGPLHVPVGALARGSVGAFAVADALSTPTWCRSMFSGPAPGNLLGRRQLVFDWLLWRSGSLAGAQMRDLHPDFVALGPGEQTLRISSALRDNARCVN